MKKIAIKVKEKTTKNKFIYQYKNEGNYDLFILTLMNPIHEFEISILNYSEY